MTGSDLPENWTHVQSNLERIRESIIQAAHQAHRDPAEVQLVAVTKTVSVAGIRAAIASGHMLFGENRMQEALPKVKAMADTDACFHMIGHLQTNKAKGAPAFVMIESVDSLRIAQALNRYCNEPMPILLEVNVGGESSKHGFAPTSLAEELAEIRKLPNLHVEGLMTVAPLVADTEILRPLFRSLRELRDKLNLRTLSMGMTNDFQVAISEGATLIRIGRAIFGDR